MKKKIIFALIATGTAGAVFLFGFSTASELNYRKNRAIRYDAIRFIAHNSIDYDVGGCPYFVGVKEMREKMQSINAYAFYDPGGLRDFGDVTKYVGWTYLSNNEVLLLMGDLSVRREHVARCDWSSQTIRP